jgi:hypothetical protein
MEHWEVKITQLKTIITARVDTAEQELQEYFDLSDSEMQALGLA